MSTELKQHYVAFLDILGFSEMVEADIKDVNQPFLRKLFRCHQAAAGIFTDHPSCTITQFSDSVVVSMPYDASLFEWFVGKIAEYQRLLLDEQLLCRGGLSLNKHFSNGSFTFSAGLIAAYHVESTLAKTPRVVISPDVIDLLFTEKDKAPKILIKEDDGLAFIDYIGHQKKKAPKTLEKSLNIVTNNLLSHKSPSVREKGIWLAAYSDHILGTSFSPKKFTTHNSK